MNLIRPMLASEANKNRLISLCEDDRFYGEKKIDGVRMLAHVGGGTFAFMSRTGKALSVSPLVLGEFKSFVDAKTMFVLDGELLDNTFWMFDFVKAGDSVTPDLPFEQRRGILEEFVARWNPGSAVRLLASTRDATAKTALAKTIIEERGEGLVFKRFDAPYLPGKKCDNFLKVKFRCDVDCVVIALGHNGKANMTLALFDPPNPKPVPVGHCGALTGDGPRVQVGDVVQVTCLYASDNNKLVQATMPKIRTDKAATDCTLDQLDAIRVNKAVVQ